MAKKLRGTTIDEKKHAVILEVAMKVFAEQGFRSADVESIAELASVGKGTVYRYFGSKEELFLAVSQHCNMNAAEFFSREYSINEDGTVSTKGQGEPNALTVLRAIAVAYAEFYKRNPSAVEIMLQERAEFRDARVPAHLRFRAEHRKRQDNFLRRAMAAGEIREVDVAQATNAYADLLFGCVVNGVLEGNKSKLVTRMQCAVDLFLHGLAPQEGV